MARKPKCAWCGARVDQSWSAINRARKIGAPIYCDRVCSGFGRRKNRTVAEKKKAKRLYDIEYRAVNLDRILDHKREYHRRTYDPDAARLIRAGNMPRHVEYCRQPEYRKWKQAYDLRRRAKQVYGPFAEAFLAQRELDREIASRASDYEIRLANGTLNKKIERTRDAASNR